MARILVIEDEKEILEIIQMLLEHGNHQILTAMDGEKGLQIAREQRPDLILLDVALPKMNGNEVNKALLSDPGTRTIPVVVVTTEPPADNQLAEAENVRLYLQKPFDAMTLLDKIRMVLASPPLL